MTSLIDVRGMAMKNIVETEHPKVRTTLYLTAENKERLDRIPRGQKTALMNRAIATALRELDRKKNAQVLLDMVAAIEPVRPMLSSEDMVRSLRENKEITTQLDSHDE